MPSKAAKKLFGWAWTVITVVPLFLFVLIIVSDEWGMIWHDICSLLVLVLFHPNDLFLFAISIHPFLSLLIVVSNALLQWTCYHCLLLFLIICPQLVRHQFSTSLPWRPVVSTPREVDLEEIKKRLQVAEKNDDELKKSRDPSWSQVMVDWWWLADVWWFWLMIYWLLNVVVYDGFMIILVCLCGWWWLYNDWENKWLMMDNVRCCLFHKAMWLVIVTDDYWWLIVAGW